MPQRGTVPIAVRVVAVALAVVAVLATFRPWSRTLSPVDGTLDTHSMWTSSAGGAAGLTLGTLLLAAGTLTAGRVRPTTDVALVALGPVVVVGGALALMVARYRSGPMVSVPASVAPVTVAIAGFTPGPDQRPFPPSPLAASAWVVVVAAAALALAVIVLARFREPASPRRGAAVATVASSAALVAVVVGASVLPWRIGTDLLGESLWRSGRVPATGAALAVVAALLLLAALLSRVPARATLLAPTALFASAVGLGLLVPEQLPLFGVVDSVSYSFRTVTDGQLPSQAALHASGWLVVGGATLVTLVAAATTWLSAPPLAGGGTGPRLATG